MRRHLFRKVASIGGTVSFVLRFLKEHSLKMLLWAVELSKSSYYEYRNRKTSKQERTKNKRRVLVKAIFLDNKGIYGARKIQYLLKTKGIQATVRTVSNDLKSLGLQSCYVKKYRPKSQATSDSFCINHLKTTVVKTPLEYVATDIIYIYTKEDQWVYPLTFLDLYTRKVLHFDISRTMDKDFVNKNIEACLRKVPTMRMIHSDRGSQYTSASYRHILKEANIEISYSAKGYPYDNAIMESYHTSLKIEKLYRTKIINLQHAKELVFQYYLGFYNSRRIHQSLGYKTPNQFETIALVG